MYKVFTEIETTALSWSIKFGDEQWQADIVAQLYKLSIVEQSEQKITHSLWAERNYDFHLALIAGCQSPILLEMRHQIYMKFDRYCQMSYQLSHTSEHKNHECHKKLADAVLQRNEIEAKKIMVHHINGPLHDVIKLFQQYKYF